MTDHHDIDRLESDSAPDRQEVAYDVAPELLE